MPCSGVLLTRHGPIEWSPEEGNENDQKHICEEKIKSCGFSDNRRLQTNIFVASQELNCARKMGTDF